MAEGSLGALDEGLADVGNAEGGLVGTDDVVVDDRGEVEGDVVLGHADLLGDLDDLNLDINLDEALRKRVDLDEARVNGLVETAELSDKTDIALVHVLVGVWTADATGNGADGTNNGAEAVDCA